MKKDDCGENVGQIKMLLSIRNLRNISSSSSFSM